MKSCHDFLSSIAGVSTVTFLPGQTQTLSVEGAANEDAIIDSVEGVRIRAQCKCIQGMNNQCQARAIYIFPSDRIVQHPWRLSAISRKPGFGNELDESKIEMQEVHKNLKA